MNTMPYQANSKLKYKWFAAAAVIAGLVSSTLVSQLMSRGATAADPPSTTVIDENLTKVVNQLKPNLPTRLDDATTLIDVWHTGKQLTYLYEVDTHGRQIPSNFTAIARNVVMPKVCGSGMKDGIVRYGITYVYRYNLRDGSRIGEFAITASDCT